MAIISETVLESNKKIRVNFDGGNLSSGFCSRSFITSWASIRCSEIVSAQRTLLHSESTKIMRIFYRCSIRLPAPIFRTITPTA